MPKEMVILLKANRHLWEKFIVWYSALSIAITIFVFFYYANPFIPSFDAADFVLALDRFDLLAMQPHFPGYPYFILGGRLLSSIIGNPAQALSLFNSLFYLTALIPVYLLFHRLGTGKYSILAAASLYTASFLSVSVNQPMSEGAALAALWWFLWSLQAAFDRPGRKTILTCLFMLGILLGIRLSYIPFAFGVLLLFFGKWRSSELSMAEIINYLLAGAAFQLIWVAGLAGTEGGFNGLFDLAIAFTGGHFEDWGGTAASSAIPLYERLGTLIFKNLFWTGLSARSGLLAAFFIVLIVFTIHTLWKERKFPSFLGIMVLLFTLYFLWAFFAQNTEKARHILPLAGLMLIFIMAVLLSGTPKKMAVGLCVGLVAVQCWLTAGLMEKQSSTLPAVYQLAEYMETMKGKTIVYTWEESRVFQALDVPFPHKKIYTYDVFRYDAGLHKEHSILLTGKVAEGFREQGMDIHDKIEKVEEFQSDPLFEPVYNDIVLYRWKQ